jgi:hypothetical protein
MAHPLDGVYAKVARADAHFDAIKEAVDEFVGPEPDLLPGEFDRKAHQYVFRAQRDSRSPTWLSPLIGDCVHNLRAALDYLIWELAPASARADSKQAGRLEFPIFTDPDLYRRWAPQKIGSLPPGAQTTIEILQPFYGPNSKPFDPAWRDPLEEPLTFLYELDKWDKHRALNLTEDRTASRLIGFEQLGIQVPPTPAILPGRFERDAILAVAHVPLGRPDVDVYLSTAYDVAFDRDGPAAGEPVVQTLDNIRKDVRKRVIPAIERYFPAPHPPREPG